MIDRTLEDGPRFVPPRLRGPRLRAARLRAPRLRRGWRIERGENSQQCDRGSPLAVCSPARIERPPLKPGYGITRKSRQISVLSLRT